MRPPGIYVGIEPEEYYERALGVASKSSLDLVRRSPAHYHAWATGSDEREETPALEFGSAVHVALLEPERFDSVYTQSPDFGDLRTKVAREARDEWRAANAGRKALSLDDWERIERMRESIARHSLAASLLRGGRSEVSAYWDDPETGLRCKSRVDYMRGGILIDLKTTDDASPGAFPTSCARYGYHRQDAMYTQAWRACGADVDAFVFIAVEKRAPFAVGVHVLDGDAKALGASSIRRDLETLADCLALDDWPAYGEQIHTLSLPRWAA